MTSFVLIVSKSFNNIKYNSKGKITEPKIYLVIELRLEEHALIIYILRIEADKYFFFLNR